MEFRILGPLEVLDSGHTLPLPRGRARALLAVLVLHAGEAVPAERLIDQLWGGTPTPTASTALQVLVSQLRKLLGPALIETRGAGYTLAVDLDRIDANRFRRLVHEAAGTAAKERAATLRHALDLWRGPALADFSYEPFTQSAIAGLDELRTATIEERIDADLEVGRHVELVAELETLTAAHPLRERLRGQLMLALYRAGRQADALEVYRDLRQVLTTELGIEPSPPLRELELAILRQDTALDQHSVRYGVVAKPEVESLLPTERKTVTVVVLGLEQADWALDPEVAQPVIAECVDSAAEVIAQHGGTVERFVGSTVVGVFGLLSSYEDDALRAVRAARALSRAIAGQSQVNALIGVESGEILIRDLRSEPLSTSGAPFTVAARLQRAAAAGEVLIGDEARRLVRDAVLLDPMETSAGDGHPWRLLDVIPGAPAVARSFDAPMVGRLTELGRLRAALDQVVRHQRARRVTVVGEAGIGKSKLAREFAAALAPDTLVLTGHCPAYGQGITFWPLREVVVQATGDDAGTGLRKLLAHHPDQDVMANQIAAATGLTPHQAVADKLFPGVRCLLEGLAASRPAVVVLEDLHWAQPTFLDLIEYLVDGTRAAVLLVCLTRPELLDDQPAWRETTRHSQAMVLGPLGAEGAAKLAADRLTGRTLTRQALSRVIHTAQGNPLYLEQILAAVDTDGEFTIPPSLQALLAARLDRLGPAERDVLRCASVVGADFSREALDTLLPEQAHPHVDRHLESLTRKELIRPTKDGEYRFHHVLIQLAAYRSITHEQRSQLHEGYAYWLKNAGTPSHPSLDELVGYHLEQAYVHRRALGARDAVTCELAVQAGETLVRAGRRAYGRFDIAAAENLWSRATALLPPSHQQRHEIVRRLAEAYQVLGRHADADSMLSALRPADPVIEQEVRMERARIHLFTGPDPIPLREIETDIEQAMDVFDRAGNESGLALACYLLWEVHLRRADPQEMERVARRSLAHAGRSADPRDDTAARVAVAETLLQGPTSVTDGLRECAEMVTWRGTEHPVVLAQMAHLTAMLGEFAEARELIARARHVMVERIRARRPFMFIAQYSAAIELLAGQEAAAEEELRTALRLATEMGERTCRAQTAARLSRLLAEAHSPDAETFSSMSIDAAPADDVPSQALVRAARAKALLSHEDHHDARRLAREAVGLVPRGMPILRGELLVNLAEILVQTGELDEAVTAVGEAVDLYGAKGDIESAARARALAS